MTRCKTRLAAFAVSLASLAGCPSAPTVPEAHGPVAPPRVATRVSYQLGGPLHGAIAPGRPLPAEALQPDHALALYVSVVALASSGPWTLAPLTSQSRIVMAEGEAGDTIRATPRVLEHARAGLVEGPTIQILEQAKSDAQARGNRLGTLRACLIAGTTTVAELVRDEPPTPTGEARRERAAVLLGRRADGKGVDLALELESDGEPPELVELATPVFGPPGHAGNWVAVIPSPFAGDEATWIAFIAHATPPPEAAIPGAAVHEEVVAGAVRDLVAQEQTAALATKPLAPPAEVPDVDATRRALGDRLTARHGLFALANSVRSRTAEAIAVATDDHTLAPIATAVIAALSSATAMRKPDEMGLVVEIATLSACQKLLTVEPVAPDLVSALEWRGGAALKLLPSLGPEILRAKTLADLENRIVTLNVRLLNDASPAVRARAARWLGARLPLEGYSPIASSVERRAAVEKIKKHQAEAAQ
jgi:hypothetical protein